MGAAATIWQSAVVLGVIGQKRKRTHISDNVTEPTKGLALLCLQLLELCLTISWHSINIF